jgi:hypothetical protein
MKGALLGLFCLGAMMAAPAAASETLGNPGFESGALSPWFNGNNLESGGGVTWHIITSDTHSGTYAVEDTGNIELRQNFSGVAASSISQVSFWLEHPNLVGAALAFDFYYSDSTSVENLLFTSGTGWEFFDVTSYLNSSKTLTGFSIYGYGGGVTRVDALTISTGGAVPEPATWALMLLGFAAIGMTLRRQRAKQAGALAQA